MKFMNQNLHYYT